MGNQNQNWGAQLKKFRMSTGLSQAKFCEELTQRIARLDDGQREDLEKIGLAYDFLGNTELSRYENGKRLPRYRSRYIFLIWGLVELGGIKSTDAANDWLFLVDQSPLTEAETEAIFIKNGIEPPQRPSLEENAAEIGKPAAFNRPTLWGAGLVILLLVLALGFVLRDQLFGRTQPAAISESNNGEVKAKADAEQVEAAPTATEEPATATPTDMPTATPSPTKTPVPPTPTEEIPTKEPQPAESLNAWVSNLENWKSDTSGEADHNVEIKDGRLCSTILQGSIYPWELKLNLDSIPLEGLTTYEISFVAESDTERSITISLASDSEGSNGYFYSTQPLIAGINEVKVPFIQTVADPAVNFRFWIGRGDEGVICFEEIALTPIGTIDAPAAGDAVSPASLIKKGDFSNGGLERPWWLFEEGIGAFRTYVEENRLCSQVIKPPPNLWDLTIGQHEITLTPEGRYRLTFDVEADRDMDLLVLLKSNIQTHLDETATISTGSSQSLSYEFVSDIEDSASFSLRFGGQDGTICFDNIELLPIAAE